MIQTVRLTGLVVYPVKSCRGIPLREALVTPHGLAHDREWMVVDEEGTFITQRKTPRMALVETALTSDALELRAPGMEPLTVPRFRPAGSPFEPTIPVSVWRHTTEALDEGERAAAWFSECLEQRARLVRWDPTRRRLSSKEWTGSREAENYFSDGYPFLVASEESLADLNQRIGGGSDLRMDRFRPNLVIAGGGVGSEDQGTTLRTESCEFARVKPCIRCVMTTTDQQTARRGPEPLRTLARYRMDPRFDSPLFGHNLILIRGAGAVLRVGDTLETF
ncbi:MAG: hypothetical protein RIT19_1292 [Verrucomicrobiota bacterium]|jgi:uncharacterized protein YcbX